MLSRILSLPVAKHAQTRHSLCRAATRLSAYSSSSSSASTAPVPTNGLQPFACNPPLAFTASATTEVSSFSGDLLIVPFYKPTDTSTADEASIAAALKAGVPTGLPAALTSTINDIIDDCAFNPADKTYVTRLSGRGGRTKHVALVGMGALPPSTADGDSSEVCVQTALLLGRAAAALSKETKAATVGVVSPTGALLGTAGVAHILQGIADAAYADNRYRKTPSGGFPAFPLQDVRLLGCSHLVVDTIQGLYESSQRITSGVNFARDLVSAPSNCKTPVKIAQLAREMAAEHGMECQVLGHKECTELGMDAYLAVQQGSRFEPQFVHMVYRPTRRGTSELKRIALVGKGLTFDSGGYNLKVGAGSMIELMKFDMGGCSAVLGAAKALSQLQPSGVEVHFITAICENMVSAEAMRPGDVLVASNGKTIEVLNTDAEGRLTLADALVYADNLKPHAIVDLATLTGACVVGLGDQMAALYANDDGLSEELTSAAQRTGEGIWRMPLHQDYKSQIKGTLADLANIGAAGRGGGSITAALFLQEFVGKETKWAHIDMAGPVWDTEKAQPTGYGVKLLVDYVLNTTTTTAKKGK